MDITIILYIIVVVILMYLLRPRNEGYYIPPNIIRGGYIDPDSTGFEHSPAL